MNDSSSKNPSRRKFIRNTSLAATGFLIPHLQVLGLSFVTPSKTAFAPNNPIQLENAKAGTISWQLTNPAVNREVEGYASLTSVNRGGQIKFFISVATAQMLDLQIYRMGWYGGKGGRLLAEITNISVTNQPTPTADANGLIECNWVSQYTLNVPNNTTDPTDWPSGIYLVKLTAKTSNKQSYIIFVLRDDRRISDFLYQASFSTYQAYNNWPYSRSCGTNACPGSRSLYPYNSDTNGAAWKVSFNRPFAVGLAPQSELGVGAGEFLNNLGPGRVSYQGAGWEYNMVRWLEMRGYDVTYATNIDTHEKADLFFSGTTKMHKGFLSVGHDEYWSWQMRTQVEQARDNGVSLGFFSSNVCYWQVRFESSLMSGQVNRTMVCYKYFYDSKDPYFLDLDPSNDHLITKLWRENTVKPPEAALVGVMYWGNSFLANMVITKPDHWICSGTNLALNETLPGLIGYECDSVFASSPSNIEVVAHSPVIDTRYSDMTIYTSPSGAIVFGAGSNQLSWGLDDYYASSPFFLRPSRLNSKFQQMISNLLARFVGDIFPVARPGGPYCGLVRSVVSFNGTSSSDADGTIISYVWTFGDGATATGAMASHAYASAGTFNVNLVVIDDKGAAHSSSTSVVISNLTATARSNSPICAGQTLILTGGPAAMTTYEWTGPASFNNATQSPSISNATTAASGAYTLTVTDSNGCKASITINAIVNPKPATTLIRDFN